MTNNLTTGSFWSQLPRQARLTFVVASGAWFFDCFDAQIFNLARAPAAKALAAPGQDFTVVSTVSMAAFLVGWGIGGLFLGALGDRIGRARTLAFSVMIYSIFTGLSAFATGTYDFALFRFLTGIGVGGVFGLSVALIADSTPANIRPKALGAFQAISTIGNISAGLVGLGLATLITGDWYWKSLFIVGSLPAMIFVMGAFFLKEPESWVQARQKAKGVGFGSYSVLLKDPKWKSRAWLALAVCSAGIIGLWGLGNFQPEVIGPVIKTHYQALDSTITSKDLEAKANAVKSWALMLQNIGGFFGMLICSWGCLHFGRKKALATSLIASALGTMLLFKGLTSYYAIFWIIPLMGMATYAPFAAFAIVLPELFPIHLRSTGPSFAYNCGRFAAAGGVIGLFYLTRILKDVDHPEQTLENFRTAGFCMSFIPLIGLLALYFLPETKDAPLPE